MRQASALRLLDLAYSMAHQNFELPSSQMLLRQFAKHHSLKFSEIVSREEGAIRSISIANILINDAYIDPQYNEVLLDPCSGLLLNMLHRNYELVAAAIVAFVTGSGASAEITARASVEASVNIAYILAGDRQARLKAYFEYYFDDVDRQVDKWRSETRDLPLDEIRIHEAALVRRQAANDKLRHFTKGGLGTTEERWPNSIAARFRALNEGLTYRTFYARMSSESHADAEETLRYFFGRVQDDEKIFEAMALETVWMTRLYFYHAALWHLRASVAYAENYRFGPVALRIKTELDDTNKELIQISKHVGAAQF
jgi:Family of unknown function (DUF5677)